IAELDQSGGSTPKVLELYGVHEDEYSNDEEMFNLVHKMRSRIITSPSLKGDKLIGAILFEHTMNNKIEDNYTKDYLKDKVIVSCIKINKDVADIDNLFQLMKPMPELDA